MTTRPIALITTLKIENGKLGEFKDAVRKSVEFVTANEPQLIAFHVYIDEQRMEANGFQIHPNPESIELHFKVIGPFMRNTLQYSQTTRVELYGDPGERVLGMIRQIVAATDASLAVKGHLDGFSRFQGT